jgi:uncharacterized phage protein gp47/JayE
VLDDRRFEQILRELQLRIPVYTREWTDFNESDPGTTLLQLFAWLTETTLHRLNQLPDAAYIKFLQLLGQEQTAAKPSSAFVTFKVTPGARAQPIPKGAQLSAQPPAGGDPVIFEMEEALDLIQAQLSDVGVFEGAGFTRRTPENDTPGRAFRPFGHSPVPGNALYLGFEPLPAGATHRVFPPKTTFRAFLPEATLAGKPQRVDADVNPTAPVTVCWEFRRSKSDSAWRRLNLFEDGSLAFTREGFIRIEGPPANIEPTIEPRLSDKPRYWIRCRLEAGSYDAGKSPELDFLEPNTGSVKALATLREVSFPDGSDGTPDQVFTLRRAPVYVDDDNRADPLGLENRLDGKKVADWQRRDDFLSSGPDDRHYVLNTTTGAVRFGSGRKGRIPEPGSEIVATAYRTGGGKRGDVGAGLISTMQTSLPGVESVTNLRAAVGGSDEQTLDDLKEHAPQLLARGGRAITPKDFASFAKEVGGVIHAKALALWHPDHPGVEVPGAVTVVIVPDSHEKKALPSGDLIRAVSRKLDEYRLITTEVYVKGPDYTGVRVEATVEAKPHASFDTVTRTVIDKLNEFLSPRNRQRDFGDDLIPTELYHVIRNSHPDVSSVTRLNVYVDGRPQRETTRIVVPPDGLLFSEDHTIVVVPEKNV